MSLHFSTADYPSEIRTRAFVFTITLLVLVPPPVLYFLLKKIAENHRLLAQVRRLAETDPLTGLTNRLGLDLALENVTRLEAGRSRNITLILFDLDDFKGINDRHGHLTGDAVLKRIARRVSRLPNVVCAARIGGDEFAVLVENDLWCGENRTTRIAQDVATSMEILFQPIHHNNLVIRPSGSAGLSQYKFDASDTSELRRNASASLLDAKRKGRQQISIYNPSFDVVLKRRRLIQGAILSGEYAQQIGVVFQPIVELSSGMMKSVEVLARWHHAELGSINPPEFLTIARECGRGEAMEFCLRSMALEEMGTSLRSGLLETISFNCSPIELAKAGFAEQFLDHLAAFDINPRKVWVEITEDEKLTKMAAVSKNLDHLCYAGIRIALDDYGIGYSNIQRLSELPIHRIKIDKSIVARIASDRKMAGIFKSCVQLAKSLGAEVVAEGVETNEQSELTQHLGCKLVQGYLYCKPVPASDCLDLFDDMPRVVA